MPLNFALNSDLHPKSAPTTLSCVSGGCLLVLYFRGAGLTLCAGPDVTLPGGIPWPGCRKMFLRTQRGIQSWKPGQHCPRDIPFPGRKAGTREGRLPILYDWEQEGDIFTSRKVWWSLSCFLSPAYMDKYGCWSGYSEDFWGKARQWGFLKDFGSPVYSSDFLLEVFGGLCITLEIKDRLTWA